MTIKRYAFSLVLALFAIGGVGTYCVYSASVQMPEYRLKTIEGDAALAKGLLLSGNYEGRLRSRFVKVTSDGSSYTGERTPFFFEQFGSSRSWYMRHSGIGELVRDYRGFMRGKSNPWGLYKEEDRLVYAEADVIDKRNLRLRLEMLDTATGRSVKHATDIPVAEGLDYAFVADVQRIRDEFHLIVHQSRIMITADSPQRKSSVIEFRDYVVDAGSGKVVREVSLSPDIDKDDARLDISLTQTGVANSSDYSVIQVDKRVTGPKGDQVTDRYLYAYRYATGRLVRLPDALTSGSRNMYAQTALDGNRLNVVAYLGAKGFRMRTYELDTGKLSEEIAVTAEQLGASLPQVFLEGDRIYLLLHKGDATQAAVMRAADGEILYRGEVEFVGPASEAAEAMVELQIHNLWIRT